MFHRKSKADKAREEATSRARRARKAAAAARVRAAEGAQHGAASVRHTVRDRVGPRAAAAAGAAGAHAMEYRDRAVAGLDHGIDAAVPRVEHAVADVAPKVDHARDVIVEDLLPKLSALVASVQVSKDELLARKQGPVAAVTGAPKRRRKGGVLIALGLLSAVGAGVAWYLGQQSRDQRDPWAALPSERPIGGAPGVDTQVRQETGSAAGAATGTGTAAGVSTGAAAGTTGAATGTAAGTTGAPTDTAAGTTGSTTGTGGTVVGGTAAVGTAADEGTAEVGDAADVGGTATGEATRSDTDTPAEMLDSEQVDALAADTPEEADDLPGSNTDTTTGFGTEGREEPENRRD